MSLKTADSELERLGLERYSIVYDDEENEPGFVAFLYSADGSPLGTWDNHLRFSPRQSEFAPPEKLTLVVSQLRVNAGFVPAVAA